MLIRGFLGAIRCPIPSARDASGRSVASSYRISTSYRSIEEDSVTSKWEELSAAVGAWQDRQQSDSFVAGRFAAMIGNSFADYVEAPTKTHIKFFRYIPDEYNPERDKYEEVGNGFSAVSQSLDGRWQFGLGIVLERAPHASPKFSFHWPMLITLGNPPKVDIAGGLKFDIPDVGGNYQVEHICAAMFNAIKESLLRTAQGTNQMHRIGFNAM
jgi:hypothetical protein